MENHLSRRGSRKFRLGLWAGISASVIGAPLAWSGSAAAQNAPAASGAAEEQELSEVVVTGSRIAGLGFSSPTPVTVATAEQLKAASPLVIEGLKDLPALNVGGSRASGSGGGGGGQATINLRVLGASRVLVLLDGRRVAPERGNGQVDVSLMPNPLVNHVEIVTGGASAAYGSDAVAGVVNFVLDKSFTGIRGNAYAGVSDVGDRGEYGAEVGLGTSFAGGRGHFLTSLEYTDQKGLRRSDRAVATAGYFLLTNPVTGALPTRLHVEPGHFVNGAPYGLVTTGALKGLTFDPDGTPRQFQYGALAGSQAQVGGDGINSQVGPGSFIVAYLNRGGMFNRVSFDITNNFTAFAENQLYYTDNLAGIGWGYSVGATGYVIRQDNAFLDPNIKARMVALNLQSFRLDRNNGDFPNNDIDTKSFKWRPLVGANFKVGTWDGEVYFTPTYSKRRLEYHIGMDQIRSIEASDAVIAPVGAPAGIVPGAVVCRATLTGTTFQGKPCIPLNVMGTGSPAAIAAINREGEWNQDVYKQQNFSVSINGTLLTLPAGKVGAAVGLDYRHEDLVFTSDPYSQVLNPVTNALGGWRAGNAQPYTGNQTVREAFAEINIPLLKNMPLANSLDLNGAARYTDYRTSGTVHTWKFGLMYRPVANLLIRGTRSRDIRAPNLSELYNKGTAGTGEFRDPFKGNITVGGVKTFSAGNPNLTPEIGDTTVYGGTYEPSWFGGGLGMTVDYWKINLKDAIGTIANQTIIDDCFANPTSYECDFILRDATGTINTIRNLPINFSTRVVQGVDYELSYRTSLSRLNNSNLSLRLVATDLRKDYTNSRGIIDTSNGEIGDPRWKVLAQMVLRTGAVTTTLSGHYISACKYDNIFVEGVDIDYNTVPSYQTWDARVSYEFPERQGLVAYVSAANLLDTKPVPVYSSDNATAGTNAGTYDIIGRFLRAGLTFKF